MPTLPQISRLDIRKKSAARKKIRPHMKIVSGRNKLTESLQIVGEYI
jgi:hypothetical protein